MPHRKPSSLVRDISDALEVQETQLMAMAIPRPPRVPTELSTVAAIPVTRSKAVSGVRWIAVERRAQKNAERFEAITEGPPPETRPADDDA